MAKTEHLDRRGFLKGAAAGVAAGATTLVSAPIASAATPKAEPAAVLTPEQAALALAVEAAPLPPDEVGFVVSDPGSDFMVDVIKTLGFEYIASNPASSFRGIHESFINYGKNTAPEWITCMHEEVAANIANGYYAVEGKPMAVATFAPCGLLHATMGIFGAFTGHAPTYILCATILDAVEKRPTVDWWEHSVMDPGALTRDFTKWDDTPVSLQHFAESAVRAYKMAMTEPRGPVMIVLDGTLQENPVPDRSKLHIPKLTLETPPVGDPNAIAETAKLLVAAENPLILAGDVARDEEGRSLLVELAETLQAPVQGGGRGMPNQHPLSVGGSVSTADVILALGENFASGLYDNFHDYRDQAVKTSSSRLKPGTKVISISTYDLYMRSNYQNVDRYQEVDLSIAGDPQATLPSLIEACKKLITSDQRIAFDARGKKHEATLAQTLERMKVGATYGWDASPISTQRLSMEVYDVIKDKDWASLAIKGDLSRLWKNDKFYRHPGYCTGGGVGGDFPAAVGAALAHKKHGRFCVTLQRDGDMMYVNNALWTATHHKIPMLICMLNNRAYHQEVMHVQRMANRRQRGVENICLGAPGTFLREPNVDFAMLAKSMGAYAEGPISDPKELRPAILRAVAQVEKGEVALLDTITQPQ